MNNLIEKFDKIVSYIKRDGIESLVQWLKSETDFFTAPASTNFHCNYETGLLEHSINVTEFAINLFNILIKKKPELEYLRESVILCSIFHDVCKVNQYKQEQKWIKDNNNNWQQYPSYSVDDNFPMGHGCKSVYLINQFIKLENYEVLAITHHMGFAGVAFQGLDKYSYDKALNHPLVRIIQSSDIMSSTIEETIDYKNLAINK